MSIAFGNLSIKELEQRTGWSFSTEDRKWLESHRQDVADVKVHSEKFHIFDAPFHIEADIGIKSKLMEILLKYENATPSKEPLQIGFIKETEKEKERRLKKEAEEKERKERDENPSSVWNVKWHMMIPVVVDFNGKKYDLYYGCFINTYTTGKMNIPKTITGTAWIERREEGLYGRFELFDPAKDSDADPHPDWNHVVGNGFYHKSGSLIENDENFTFERVEFSIREAIENYSNIKGWDCKEIHFYS